MSHPIQRAAERAIQAWRTEARDRKRVTAVDPVADTMEYLAADLAERLREASVVAPTYTVAEYAEASGVTRATVRRWCRRALVPAQRDASGEWVITRPPMAQLKASA